jgi:hypothetical protein
MMPGKEIANFDGQATFRRGTSGLSGPVTLAAGLYPATAALYPPTYTPSPPADTRSKGQRIYDFALRSEGTPMSKFSQIIEDNRALTVPESPCPHPDLLRQLRPVHAR